MLPQTHKIISEHLYENVRSYLGVELNKNSLIYGSIKPDFAPHLLKLDHFKPQSFNLVMDEIHKLSRVSLEGNDQFMKDFSVQIGVVTHFIADFFCVPHNDRVTYRKATIINHLLYENKLHRMFKGFQDSIKVSNSLFNPDNGSALQVKNMMDKLHKEYQSRQETMKNDLESSLRATTAVGLYIVYHAMNQFTLQSVA